MNGMLPLALLVPAACIAQAPVITFEKTHHDFGRIGGDRKVSYRFKVTNTGKATLNITGLRPSCGCTSTVLGKWSLEPGESTEVEASFDPHGFRGQVHKSIQVVSDDPAHGTVTLTFEADVIQEIMPSTTMVFFSDLTRTATKQATVRLASGNGQPIRVKEIKIPGAPHLSATAKYEGNDAILDIALDGRKVSTAKQRGVDAITVVTASERTPTVTLRVQWELKASVVASPERVGWTEAAGKALRSSVTLKQIEGKLFRILDYKSSTPLLTLEGVGRTGAAQQDLQVVFAAGAKPGTYNENVILFLDDPDQPEFLLRVSAILR